MDKARSEADAKTRSGYLHQAEDEMMTNGSLHPAPLLQRFLSSGAKVTGSWHSYTVSGCFRYADVTE